MPSISFPNMFMEMTALLFICAAAGYLSIRLKQPVILGFLAVGILIGTLPIGKETAEHVELLAEMGLALLLFIVGLKLDLNLIRRMGKVALATGLGQVLFTSIGGYILGILLGLNHITSIYVAVALTFSSTIIIVKLLSDKKEVDALHGQIAIGFLIVQDIVVVLAMIALSSISGDNSHSLGMQALYVVTKGAVLLTSIAVVSLFIIPKLIIQIARSIELLVLFAIAWALLLASLGSALGFSHEVGAFLAGVSLASTPFREIIGARLVSLRDFLLMFFFIKLGSSLDLSLLGAQVGTAVPLSLFVLIGNPIIVMIIMGFMGYRKRTSFMAGLTVAQISEFSLMLMALGYKKGQVDESAVGLVTLVGLVTISLSTYMILYSQAIYDRIGKYLQIFERKTPHKEQQDDSTSNESEHAEIILYGLGRYGSGIALNLKEKG
ncbi:MAG: cation:proton antiporter, partial [Armatimonadota bacterium]